jgi:uncharacterized membrane protein SpoIIM required for sporulation
MKVSDILDRRRENWHELEQLALRAERQWQRPMTALELLRLATLYRAACADLALADAYQLPPNTVQYLHRLVGRAHNQLYRTRKFDWQRWRKALLEEVPRRIFHDRCVQMMFALFWGVFVVMLILAARDAEFARQVVGPQLLNMLQDMHQSAPGSHAPLGNPQMASFYIQHNTTIGLQCFAGGLLIIPGIAVTVFNAAHLGAIFGYMASPEVPDGSSFFHFVTAHGPFELTAIVLSAGAGLRLGMAWLDTQVHRADRTVDREVGKENAPPSGPLTRESSLRQAAAKTMPLMGAAMVLFFLAALIEGFLSPSILPYWLKASVCVFSILLLVFYFVVLGFPKRAAPG